MKNNVPFPFPRPTADVAFFENLQVGIKIRIVFLFNRRQNVLSNRPGGPIY